MSDELPQGWTNAPLDSLCFKVRGVSYQRQEASHSPKNGYKPVLRANNIINDQLTFDELVWVPASRVSEQQNLQKGDVVIAMSSGSKSIVGKTAQIMREWNGSFGAFCGVLRPFTKLDSRYIGLFLRTRYYRQKISELSAGTNINNLKNEYFSEIEVPLAPIKEQRRIVALLEDLLAKADTCQTRLEKIRIILKRFRQSVLAAACSGRLTDNWRERRRTDDSVDLIVGNIKQRLEAEAKSAAEKEELRQVYANVEGNDSSELPDSWKYISLNKLCSSFDYGTSAKSQPSGKIPVLRMGNIQDGKLDWTNLVYTSDKKEIKKYYLKPNTVLFNRTNSPELVGKTAIYRGEQPAIFAGYLIRANPYPELDPEYLNLCLNTTYAKAYCASVKSDGVSQSNINAKKLGAFEMPFCNLSEQKEIVRRVEALFAFADEIETRYSKAKAHVGKITQSILAKAFRGELVAQDPNDEPADMLLKRVRECQLADAPDKKKMNKAESDRLVLLKSKKTCKSAAKRRTKRDGLRRVSKK